MRFRHPYNSNIGKQCVRWVSPAMLVFTPQLRSRSPILNMNTEFYNAAQVTLHQQQKQEQQKQPQWQSEKEMTTSSNNRAAAGSGGSSGSTSESRSGKTSESFSSSGSGSRRNSTKSLTYRYPWPHLHTRKRLLRVFLCWTAAGGSHSHSNTYWRPKLAAATFPLQQWCKRKHFFSTSWLIKVSSEAFPHRVASYQTATKPFPNWQNTMNNLNEKCQTHIQLGQAPIFKLPLKRPHIGWFLTLILLKFHFQAPFCIMQLRPSHLAWPFPRCLDLLSPLPLATLTVVTSTVPLLARPEAVHHVEVACCVLLGVHVTF